MKRALLLLMLFSGIILFSCSKSQTGLTGKSSITGTWKLAETLADPGDGSGTWRPAASPLVLTFHTNGGIAGDAFPQAQRYEVLSEKAIKFIYADETFIIYNYAITGSTLLLSSSGCIEACGLKFTKNDTAINTRYGES